MNQQILFRAFQQFSINLQQLQQLKSMSFSGRINQNLYLKIVKSLQANPNSTEEALFEQISNNSEQLRLSKDAIRSGIKQYFKKYQHNGTNKSKDIQPINSFAQEQIINNPKKKIKKSQNHLQLIFTDEQRKFDWNKFGGFHQISKIIQQVIYIPFQQRLYYEKCKKFAYRGYLLSGNIGSGKTTIGCCILSYFKNILQFNTFLVNCSNLITGDSDENLRKLFEMAQQSQPAFICFDDIQLLCQKENNKRPQGPMFYSLINYMDRALKNYSQIYYLGITSSLQKIDLSMKRTDRFEKIITLDALNDQMRIQILQKLLNEVSSGVASNQQLLKEFSQTTSGFVVADMVAFVKQAYLQAILRSKILNKSNRQILQKQIQKPVIIEQDMYKALTNIQPLLKKQGFAKIPQTKLSDVGALKQIKEQLMKEIILPLKEKQKFKKMNFQINGAGVLLYGPPGCGKTMIAKAIAHQAKANFIIVKGPQLLTKYVGQSQQGVRKVFERARISSPCIIFFDQFDALAPKRQDQGNQVTQRVVNTLLNELNGVDDRKMVFVIAATNRPDIIDEAILRSGRIQKHLYVPLPNKEEREDILRTIAKKVKKNQDIDFQGIAKNCQGFSGADINYLIKQSTVMAVMNDRDYITNNDLMEARKKFESDKIRSKKFNDQKAKTTQQDFELYQAKQVVNLPQDYESCLTENKKSVETKFQISKQQSNQVIKSFIASLLKGKH